MNRRSLSGLSPLFLTLALPLSAPLLTPQVFAQSKDAPHVQGEFLVRWSNQSAPLVLAPKVDPSRWQEDRMQAQVSAKVSGMAVKHTFKAGWSLLKAPASAGDEATRAQLVASLGANNVTYNYIRQASKVPTLDPDYASQWHLPQIKAPGAWDATIGSSNVVIAVLDTGVDLKHVDIKANLWKNSKEIAGNKKDDDGNGKVDDVHGFNALDPASPPQDDNGHGTHCAGLIGAVGNNKLNATGVCWNVRIMALKFLNESGRGSDAGAIECIEYAVKMKQSGVNLRAISHSWGGKADNVFLRDAFKLAENAGIINICAAGNAESLTGQGRNIETTPEYPASFDLSSIISVGASTQTDALAKLSNYGPKSVDLAAPGLNVVSLQLGGGVVPMSGTSMATPIVAGAVGLLLAKEPGLSPAQVKARILETVDPIPALKNQVLTGGRLNLQRALTNNIYNISGQVYRMNGTTKVPLVGALIKVKNKTVTSTDKNGKYLIAEISPTTYALTATLPGFAFNPVSLTLPRTAGNAGAPNGIVDFAATTTPSVLYTISGYALDTKGVPQKNVAIYITGTPESVATTATNGKYTIND
ncbi:hypothetical protein EON80_20390, partial [bacterium]